MGKKVSEKKKIKDAIIAEMKVVLAISLLNYQSKNHCTVEQMAERSDVLARSVYSHIGKTAFPDFVTLRKYRRALHLDLNKLADGIQDEQNSKLEYIQVDLQKFKHLLANSENIESIEVIIRRK